MEGEVAELAEEEHGASRGASSSRAATPDLLLAAPLAVSYVERMAKVLQQLRGGGGGIAPAAPAPAAAAAA